MKDAVKVTCIFNRLPRGELLVSLVAGVLGVANAGVTNDWNQVAAPGGNTPDTAYVWSDAGNWASSAVPMARGGMALVWEHRRSLGSSDCRAAFS